MARHRSVKVSAYLVKYKFRQAQPVTGENALQERKCFAGTKRRCVKDSKPGQVAKLSYLYAITDIMKHLLMAHLLIAGAVVVSMPVVRVLDGVEKGARCHIKSGRLTVIKPSSHY